MEKKLGTVSHITPDGYLHTGIISDDGSSILVFGDISLGTTIYATTTMWINDLHNMLPGCQVCNMYTPHHVWELGKSINRKWSEDETEKLLELAGKQLKLTNNDRKEIYDIYLEALHSVENKEYSLDERMQILDAVYEDYLRIVEKLIK